MVASSNGQDKRFSSSKRLVGSTPPAISHRVVFGYDYGLSVFGRAIAPSKMRLKGVNRISIKKKQGGSMEDKYRVQVGISKIENMVNHKIYIGKSTDIHKRWVNHKSICNRKKSDAILYRAMQKYGIHNFEFSIVEECEKKKLNEREQYWIRYYHSCDREFGYNMTQGGDCGCITSRKLTDDEVKMIHNLLPQKTQKEIAEMFGVSQSEISRINDGKTYYFDNVDYPICSKEYYVKKKKKEKNYCVDCGKEIWRNSIRCKSCHEKHQKRLYSKMYNRPTRDTLKGLIRNNPFVKVGELYGVSDNGIRKWCISMNLPSTRKQIKSYSDKEWEVL